MDIRKATIKDISGILSLMRQLVEEHRALDSYYKNFSQMSEVRSHVLAAIKSPNKLLLVAEQGSQILGYFLGAIEPAPYYSSEKKIGWVADTCVAKKYRRQGILNSFFQEALRWFHSKKISVVELSVDSRNKSAVSAWKNLGFNEYKLRMKRPI